jgi:hypothetical protein
MNKRGAYILPISKKTTRNAGNYHLRHHPTYVEPAEAERIIASYYEVLSSPSDVASNSGLESWQCRVCEERFVDTAGVREHLLGSVVEPEPYEP